MAAAPLPAVDPPTRVAGVDFSGARDARENVWVAECERAADGLRLTALAPASDRLAPAGDDPEATTAALVDWTRGQRGAVGFDFPFSLPAAVARGLGAGTWRETLDALAAFGDASAMDEACQAATPGDRTYARRVTDEAHDSFSPYHFFVKRQTYHGVAGVLAPLVADAAVRVVPMDLGGADDDRPVVLETYPAAVFARLGLHRERYKGTDEADRDRRAANLAGLRNRVAVPDRLADRALADPDGDALDALAAAVGVDLAFESGLRPAGDEATWRLEGAIYPLAGPHDTLPRDDDDET